MKPSDFSHWELYDPQKKLLFFAQTMEELLYHYGHDSLKVDALNFHYLCVEILSTLKKIEDGSVDKTYIKPLMEELRSSFGADPIASRIFGNNLECLFYSRKNDGEINRECGDVFKSADSEASHRRIETVVRYLNEEMQRDNAYFELLVDSIEELLKGDTFDLPRQQKLHKLTRLLLTELINLSYTQEYIYWVVKDLFYNRNRPVKSIESVMELFWSRFDFEEKHYNVILPIKQKKHKNILNRFANSIRVTENDKGYFGNSCKWLAEITIESLDQYGAQTRAIALVRFILSLHQHSYHKGIPYSASYVLVKAKEDSSGEEIYELRLPVVPLKRESEYLNESDRVEKIKRIVGALPIAPKKMYDAITLHAAAINSKDIENQLLNLWTIVEILIPTETAKGSMPKIAQICNVLTSIMNSQYISSLIIQLLIDLRRCLPNRVDDLLEKVEKGDDYIEKLVACLVLNEYSHVREDIIAEIPNYPLLKYRICLYADVFSDRKKIKEFLVNHRKRLNWHITRIYRNRNMIVHDGTYFPYINVIVQNLHYYVDAMIDTIGFYFSVGFSEVETIYTALQHKEFRYTLLLEEKESGGPKPIGDDFISVVLGKL